MLTASLILPEPGETLLIEPGDDTSHDALFERACELYPDYRIEQNADGDVLIMSQSGANLRTAIFSILVQLGNWAHWDGRGRVFESKALFILPDGSKRGPDAAWASNETLENVSADQEDAFLPIAPEFVIELRSKSDRSSRLQQKMVDWARNGVQLAWLIDADRRKVLIYRANVNKAEVLDGPDTVHGEGPVAGFRLDTESIWKGLRG